MGFSGLLLSQASHMTLDATIAPRQAEVMTLWRYKNSNVIMIAVIIIVRHY